MRAKFQSGRFHTVVVIYVDFKKPHRSQIVNKKLWDMKLFTMWMFLQLHKRVGEITTGAPQRSEIIIISGIFAESDWVFIIYSLC